MTRTHAAHTPVRRPVSQSPLMLRVPALGHGPPWEEVLALEPVLQSNPYPLLPKPVVRVPAVEVQGLVQGRIAGRSPKPAPEVEADAQAPALALVVALALARQVGPAKHAQPGPEPEPAPAAAERR